MKPSKNTLLTLGLLSALAACDGGDNAALGTEAQKKLIDLDIQLEKMQQTVSSFEAALNANIKQVKMLAETHAKCEADNAEKKKLYEEKEAARLKELKENPPETPDPFAALSVPFISAGCSVTVIDTSSDQFDRASAIFQQDWFLKAKDLRIKADLNLADGKFEAAMEDIALIEYIYTRAEEGLAALK